MRVLRRSPILRTAATGPGVHRSFGPRLAPRAPAVPAGPERPSLLPPAPAPSWAGRRYLFLLGTLRSGSTLLTSILCTHPEVLGYGETHLVYDSPAQLGELVTQVSRARQADPGPARYIADKLVGDDLLPRPEELAGVDLTCLFLLREPRRTLQSVVHQLDFTLDDALAYYLARLASLERYARAFARKAFLTYEELVGEPERTLAGLTVFLGLSTPLSPEYRLQPLHDVWGVGDPSEVLHAGRILANPRELTVELPEDRVAEAEQAWRRCRAVLEESCVVLGRAR